MALNSKSIFHIISGLENGGAEAVLYRLCTNDLANRHTVISFMGAGKYGSLLEEKNIKVYCLNMPKGIITIPAIIKLWLILYRGKPDIVQTWMYHADLIGGLIAKIAGVKKIFWGIHHSVLEPGKSSKITILISKINAMLSTSIPERIICCAEKSKSVHVAIGYDISRFSVIPNGYDLNYFCPILDARTRLRREWCINEDMFVIGMVSRFDPLKDHENLISALVLLKKYNDKFRCILVGHDVDGGNIILVNWLIKYNLLQNVLLLGARNDISDIMNAIDLHVLSSSSEAFPNVIVEAMACGTPCVSTDVGDARYIVNKTGWIVPTKNPNELFNAIILASKEFTKKIEWSRRQKLSRLRILNNFSIDNMINSYNNVWSCKY